MSINIFILAILELMVGYLLPKKRSKPFFQLVTKLYDTASLIITSNKGFEGWADIFGDTILATASDRLTVALVFRLEGKARLTHHLICCIHYPKPKNCLA